MKKNGAILGVIGGMGPLASAEFMSRVYRYHSYEQQEQSAPFIIHYSNPAVPDRTANFLRGNEAVVMEGLIKALRFLERAGASRYIICCFTIHHLLPKLSSRYRERIISLVDVTISKLLNSSGKYLLLATTGTRKMKLLESHPDWNRISDRILFLSDYDQERLHFYIYNYLKKGVDPLSIRDEILTMISKYNSEGVIIACTEMHLLNKKLAHGHSALHPFEVIDALDILAKNPFLQTVNPDNSLAL